MIVPRLVITHHTLLNTFLRNLKSNMYLAVPTSLRCHNAQFYSIQGMSCIPPGKVCQKLQSILLNHGIIGTHSPLAVIDSLPD